MAKKSEMANLNKGKGKIKKVKRKTTSWIPALFHHFPSDLSRQVSAGILRKNNKVTKMLDNAHYTVFFINFYANKNVLSGITTTYML